MIDTSSNLIARALLSLLPALIVGCANADSEPSGEVGLQASSGQPSASTPGSAPPMMTGQATATPPSTATATGAAPGTATTGTTAATGPVGTPSMTGPAVTPTPSVTGAPVASDTATATSSATTTAPPASSTPGDGPSASGTGGGSGEPPEMTAGGTGAAGSGGGTDGPAPSDGPVFHIFLMMGQSNMVGVAGLQASDQVTDERVLVLGGCNKPAGQWNVASPPLHDCYMNPVGPGDWFAKTLAEKLPEGHTIGLVPTAVSGESINTFISGGSHHQDILNKIEIAKNTENAHFEGIIFHQGESDTGQSWWPERVKQLYDESKEAMGIDYDIPFVAGELPADSGNCCASHNSLVHQLPDVLPLGFYVTQEGTKRFDQYHWDHDSVVIMGKRYGEKMIEALGW